MKLTRLFVIVLLIGGLVSPCLAQAKEGDKIAYVDLSRLFDEYYKTKEYDKVLEEQHKGFESQRNVMIEKIREEQSKLGLLTEDKKAKADESIEKLKAELLDFDREKKADLTKNRNEKIREILLEIEKVVSDYAEKEKYSLILNDRVLIYGDQTMNLTEPILSILNAGK